MKKFISLVVLTLLFCIPLLMSGCTDGVDTNAIASTLWNVAVNAVGEYVHRQIGVDVSDTISVTTWVEAKINGYDPEGKLTKYVNVDVIVNDAYSYVWGLIEKIPDWSPGADPDIYTVIEHDPITQVDLQERLHTLNVFK